MANAVEKKDKPSFIKRVGNFFVRIGRYFKNMWHELKKVTWPSREKLLNYTAIVVLFMVFMIVVIGLIDLGATQLVKLIMAV